jgi:hypothetical protein
MLVLAATNGVGVVLFGTLYALAGARRLSQGAFLTCLIVIFALVTALWVRAEARHRALHPARRVGRATFGLVAVIVVTPAAVLMPVFWLERVLPPEADAGGVLAPVMTLVLISLVLVVLMNLVGSAVIAGRAALRPRGERR